MRHVDEIIVHCSATTPDFDVSASHIRRWHLRRGFIDIGYHYVIKRDGTLESGRHDMLQGAHTRGHNDSSLGICLAGGIDNQGNPDSNFTLAQYNTLSKLISSLKSKYQIEKVSGHRDYSDKDCPCFDINSLLKND